METAGNQSARKGLLPAIGLFFLAPLVAEFLLGNLPIQLLPALVVLAPSYGGGALLIRETVRRAGRGWPTIVLLAAVYGIVEEAFTTQSLFNPNYLRLNLHLLQPAYIPVLGIGAWWTIFVLTLHTAWSISTSIALVEAAVPDRASSPWLGRIGVAITGGLFVFGVVVTTRFQLRQDPFLASHAQLLSSALVCAVLVALAFLLPSRSNPSFDGVAPPDPWLLGLLALAAGSAILLTPKSWNWGAAVLILAVDLCMIGLVVFWSRRIGWNMRHKLALAAGAALAYGWHAFIETPVIAGSIALVRFGNVIFALGAIALIFFAAKRTVAWLDRGL